MPIPLNDILNELRTAPRLSGTSACDAIARSLAKRFEGIGCATEIQDYTFVGWSVPEPPKVVNLVSGERLPARAVTWCGGVKGVSVEGTVVPRGKMNFWGLGTEREFSRWAIIDDDVECRAVYLIGNFGDHLVLPYPMEDVAYICMEQRDLQKLSDEEARIRLTTRTELSFGARSANVIATKVGRTANEIVVCAHHDTVYDDQNGLHDNGGACAVLLLLAEHLSAIETNHTIRFLSTGGEEFNLIGARAYLNRRERERSLGRVRACINLDCITQPPRVVHVRCIEDFDAIVKETLDAHRGRQYPYEVDWDIDRDLGCLDARAFEEKGISAFYYSPSDPQRVDEDNESIAVNLRTNALFVRDLILRTDRVFASRCGIPGRRQA